jgi:hypothetical protein
MIRDAVSTCGANTASGRNCRIEGTTSSIGAGANGACFPAPTRRAFRTVASAGIFPVSKIYTRTAPDEEFPSHYEFAEGHLLTRKRSCGFTATIGQATPIATTSAMRPLSVKTFRACPRR